MLCGSGRAHNYFTKLGEMCAIFGTKLTVRDYSAMSARKGNKLLRMSGQVSIDFLLLFDGCKSGDPARGSMQACDKCLACLV